MRNDIEGAVERGRRATKAIDEKVEVLDQYRPIWVIYDHWLNMIPSIWLIMTVLQMLFLLFINRNQNDR